MAYVVDTSSGSSGVSSTITVELPPHQNGDLLLALMAQDAGGTAITSAGWTAIGTHAASNAQRNGWFYKYVASGAPIADPVFSGATDDWAYVVVVVRDADATTPVHASAKADWASTTSVTNPALSTTADNCLIVYSFGSDGATPWKVDVGEFCYINSAASQSPVIAGWQSLKAQGAVDTVTAYGNSAEGGTNWVIAINNATGGDLRPNMTQYRQIVADIATFAAPNSIATFTSLAGLPLSAISLMTGDRFLYNLTSTEVINGMVGSIATLSAPIDLSVYPLSFEYKTATASNAARVGSEGWYVVLFDASNNYAAYRIRKRVYSTYEAFYIATVSPSTVTPEESFGTINLAAVTKVAFLYHRNTGTTSQTDGQVKAITVDRPMIFSGGTAGTPVCAEEFYLHQIGYNQNPKSGLQGKGQYELNSSIQVGDGTTVTVAKFTAQSIETPVEYSLRYPSFRAGANALGLSIYASATDSIDFSAAAVVANIRQSVSINSASSTSASYNFAGCSVVGNDVTWKTGVVCSGATFSGCYEVDLKGADPSGILVTGTLNTDSALTISENGSVIDGSTIDVTGTSAAYHIELGTSVTAITLADVTFSGTPGTDKVHVLAATGTVTITISGTTVLAAGDITSAGATVVISAPQLYQSVTISNLTTGSRVQIYDTTSSTELANEVAAGTSVTWTDSVAAVASRAIRVRIAYVSGATAKDFIESNIGTCGIIEGTEAVSYLANQVADTTYNTNAVDGSLVTGITFTDAATDLVNVNIASGNTTWQNIYAAFVYWISTAVGITDDIAYVDGVDPANYLLTSMKIKNTSSPSVPLTITGGFGRDATSGTITDIIDTTGGNIYPLVDHVVSKVVTVGGVNVITGDIADIPAAPSAATVSAQILADAATTPIAANIKQVNSLAVDGAGTEADPWGPI